AGEEGEVDEVITLSRGAGGATTGRVAMHAFNMPALQTAGFTHVLVELWLPGREPVLERHIFPVPGNSESEDFAIEFDALGVLFEFGRTGVMICRGVTLDATGTPDVSGPATRFGFPMDTLGFAIRANVIGNTGSSNDPPPPGGGKSGAPGSGTPPGI
ncbi:MAG: hypothetical protein AAFQ53_09475, partial [Bacteroidota bacterium]